MIRQLAIVNSSQTTNEVNIIPKDIKLLTRALNIHKSVVRKI